MPLSINKQQLTMSIYLASNSPRRAELLQQIGVNFIQLNAAIDESRHPDEAPELYVLRLALEKARAGVAMLPKGETGPVLGADTVVVCEQAILGKPADREAAVAMLGSLSGRRWLDVYALLPQFALGLTLALMMARHLNVLLLGDEAAAHVGLDVHRAKRWLLGVASLLAAAAVAVSGIIGFVGLIVPHICRLIVGPDHRILIPVAAATGALLLTLADIPARMALAPTELPIGIITSILGVPFFLYLLHRHGARH